MTLCTTAVMAVVAVFAAAIFVSESAATLATPSDAERAAANWTAVIVHETGDWAGVQEPGVVRSGALESNRGRVLAYVVDVLPDGFVVVPILKELPPIKLYSEEGRFAAADTVGLVQLVRERLANQVGIFVDAYGSVDAVPPERDGSVFPEHHMSTWDRLLVPEQALRDALARGETPVLRGAGPLLTTSWHQYSPYNDLCPMGDGGRCVAGCVAIATAQVMNYHAWPAYGLGEHTYWWSGDGSVPGQNLSAVFSDVYDWSGSDAGISELCYEVGVAYEMGYGHDSSGASFTAGTSVLPAYFRYDDSIAQERGSDYSSGGWFSLIQSEIDGLRPMPYCYPGHAIVCDGWRVWGLENQIDLNYGWGGTCNGWYAVDDIHGHDGDHTSEYLLKNVFPDHWGVSSSIVSWGRNTDGQCDVPTPNTGFSAISAGSNHSLGLRDDGSVEAWGENDYGECSVPTPNTDFTAVAAGSWHSLGLKGDGSVRAWGREYEGQCDAPSPNEGFVAIAAGSNYNLAIDENGSIEAWGDNVYGQCDVPLPNAGFVAVAAGGGQSLGLRDDGSIEAWGANYSGQCDVPGQNTGFVAVEAGGYHSLGLKSDGTIVAWGHNGFDQCDVPSPNAGFVAFTAGWAFSLGLREDGSIVAWGANSSGQCEIPSPNTGYVATAAGSGHGLGLSTTDTPVESVFYATLVPDDDAVQLRWILPSCSDVVGLLICRALSPDGPYARVTTMPLADAAEGSYVDEAVWPGGTFWYELRALLASGESVPVTDVHPSVTVPGTLTLGIRHVVPNPATAHTTICYSLPAGWRSARLSVHDVAGRLVRRLGPTTGAQGFVAVDWDGRASSGERAASGVYFVRLEVDGAVATRKVSLLR